MGLKERMGMEALPLKPHSGAVDAAGNLYICTNSLIRRVDTNGIISTVAGNGTEGYSGDGGPATEAQVHSPSDVAVDAAGNLYIADTLNNRIRKVAPVSAFANSRHAGNVVFAEESGLGYILSLSGSHKETIELDTGEG